MQHDERVLRRAHWLAASVLILAALLLTGLFGRVAWLQAHVTPEKLAKVASEDTAVIPIMAAPGAILDDAGNPLAVSVRMFNLFADPAFISDPNRFGGKDVTDAQKDAMAEESKQGLVEALAPLLKDLTPAQIKFAPDEFQNFLAANSLAKSGKPRRFLWIAKEVDEAFFEKFQALKQQYRDEARDAGNVHSKDALVRADAAAKAAVLSHTLDGVGFVRNVKRVYPMGDMLGQVIGFRNNYAGVDGLENQLDALLIGRAGKMDVVHDAARHTLWVKDQGIVPPDDGRNVWLTTDSVIQGITEDELTQSCISHGAESGCAVVMDPFSGRILSMANWPKFDPNHYQSARPQDRRNMCITDPYEPGSIFKPFVLGWAIDHHVVKRADVFDCHLGHYYDPTGRLVTDAEPLGLLSVEDILVKSSNIGMTQIGWKMGIPMLRDGVRTFGFGQLTGVELPGDQKGLVQADNEWSKGTLTSASFGYGVAATPLQLLRAYCTYSNGGYLVTPRILHAVEETAGQAEPWEDVAGPPLQKQIVSASTCETMREIMEQVFMRGTAKGAISGIYRLYGKTGTAHLAIKGAGHYAGDQYNSSFLAGGPMSNPKLVVVVAIHKPNPKFGHFGGVVAAPAASRILERSLQYLQVPPDQIADAKKKAAQD
jgi:cell division protein FtsI/penicillin-binding protein 2